jgi:hypothetical protein
LFDALPDEVLESIANQYRRSTELARGRYAQSSADEDVLTGALGATMSERVKGSRRVGTDRYTWKTSTWAVRGKGPDAPETEYGVDAVIELYVRNTNGDVIARKVLPMQAKKERPYSNAVLQDQAARIARLPGRGIVASFSESNYSCCDARAVAEAQGSWSNVPPEEKSDLGDLLAGPFLECDIGSRELEYDMRKEVFKTATGEVIRLPVKRRIRTNVRRSLERRPQARRRLKS